MDKKEICEKVFHILKQIFGDEENLPKTFEEEISGKIDSLKFVMLIVEIENQFYIEINEDDFEVNKLSSIEKIADIIIKYIN